MRNYLHLYNLLLFICKQWYLIFKYINIHTYIYKIYFHEEFKEATYQRVKNSFHQSAREGKLKWLQLKILYRFYQTAQKLLNQILLSSDNYWRYNPKGEDTVQILLAFYNFTLPFAILVKNHSGGLGINQQFQKAKIYSVYSCKGVFYTREGSQEYYG